MAERKCRVKMLDGTYRTLNIQHNLHGSELFDLIASQYSLQEKQYFGLYYTDDESGLNVWLDLKSKVLDQVPKSKRMLNLTFAIKIYTDNITQVKNLTTQKLFFQQVLRLISSGKLSCDSDVAFTLAAIALQAIEGDFISESATRHHLDAKKLIPDEVLVAQGSSLETCASKVSAEYETLKGMDEASAILTFMTIAQTLPQYGMHFFEVKDKSGVPWLLGVSPRGISQFYFSNPNTPRQAHKWDEIVSLSHSKNKFVMELVPPSSSSSSLQQGQASPSLPSRSASLSLSDSSASSPASSGRRIALLKRRDDSGKAKPTLVWQTFNTHYAKTMVAICKEQRRFFSPVSPKTRKARRTSAAQGLAQNYEAMALSDNKLMAPSAKEVKVPAAAKNVERLLSLSESRQRSSTIKISTTDTTKHQEECDEARLEKLLRRRRQIELEIARKEKFLQRLEQDERDYLLTFGADQAEMLQQRLALEEEEEDENEQEQATDNGAREESHERTPSVPNSNKRDTHWDGNGHGRGGNSNSNSNSTAPGVILRHKKKLQVAGRRRESDINISLDDVSSDDDGDDDAADGGEYALEAVEEEQDAAPSRHTPQQHARRQELAQPNAAQRGTESSPVSQQRRSVDFSSPIHAVPADTSAVSIASLGHIPRTRKAASARSSTSNTSDTGRIHRRGSSRRSRNRHAPWRVGVSVDGAPDATFDLPEMEGDEESGARITFV